MKTVPLIVTVLLITFAAARVTRLWDDELFVGLRARWENRFPPTAERAKVQLLVNPRHGRVAVPVSSPRRVRLPGRLMACVACRSVWVAGALVAVVWADHGLALPLLVWGAAAEGARWLAAR